ncbi:MAG: peptide ABC transporter substrate-binding protein [Eubacteriales bacterium]
MNKKILAIMLALMMVVSLAACGGTTTKAEPVVLSVNVGPEPDSIDPANNESVDGATYLVHAFEGLMKLDSKGVPVPGMAASYTLSANQLTYTFTLRDGLKWNDGQPLIASQFIYSWKRAVSPDTAAPYGYMFDVIKGYESAAAGKLDDLAVKAIDDKTIEITLNAPTPYFLELAAFPIYSPVREDIVKDNPQWATDPATYISNGPYKLISWEHNSAMVFEKNQYYYDLKSLVPDQIKFVLMDDDNAILAAFQNGAISFADTLPNDEIDAYKDKPEFFKEGQLGTYYIAFQNQKKPFNNPDVRKALSLVIDRNYICEQIGKAGQVPAAAFVPIGMSDADPAKQFRDVGGDYYSVDPAKYDANVKEAQDLLAKAGYPGGKGFPKFEYILNTSTGHLQIAEALQNMWKTKLGITATIAQQEWSVFLNTRQNGEYQVARDGWLGDYNDPISFLDMFKTGNGNNDAKYSNPAYDKLISEIKATGDRTVRYAKMHEAETILMNDAAIAPIYYYVDIFLKDPKMTGFYSSPLGYKYFMYAKIEK